MQGKRKKENKNERASQESTETMKEFRQTDRQREIPGGFENEQEKANETGMKRGIIKNKN